MSPPDGANVANLLTEVTDEPSAEVWVLEPLPTGLGVEPTRWPHFGQKTDPSAIAKPQDAHTMFGLTIDLA